jgi:site-specific DNA-methyltransferase (adenine-specific)
MIRRARREHAPLRGQYIASDSVDLVYLDPPFNSNASYNVLFKAPDGHDSHAQMEAFEDTWHWNKAAERAFDEVMQSGNTDAAEMLRAMRSFLHDNDMMAYLAMMAVRLLELHRAGKANAERLHRVLQRPAARRMPQRASVCQSRCRAHDH